MSAQHVRVVLVHGLWVHGVLMQLQRRYLARMGFDAVCYSYPSVRFTLTGNADRLAQVARTLGAPTIHWVGHSLGGLVILRMLERESALPPGRIVLAGVPYCDSHAGRALAGSALGARMLGHSMREWVDSNKPAHFPGRDIGVIAGTLSVGIGLIIAPDLPVPNDGAGHGYEIWGARATRVPCSATRRSRNSITSGKLWPVSMCITGNGKRPGRNAFSARRSSTSESLPPEKSRAGRSNSAATSRMT
jgi:pimeloyl-ACP methyl ester carboxylesterase